MQNRYDHRAMPVICRGRIRKNSVYRFGADNSLSDCLRANAANEKTYVHYYWLKDL